MDYAFSDAAVELLLERSAATESYHATRVAIGAAAVSEVGETGTQVGIEDAFTMMVRRRFAIELLNALAAALDLAPAPRDNDDGDDVVGIVVSKPTATELLIELTKSLGGVEPGIKQGEDRVRAIMSKPAAVELLNSLIINLGMVPGKKGVKGKGGKGGTAYEIGKSGLDRSGDFAEPADEVDCTVYAPGQAPTGTSFLVQVFAHLPEQAADLEQIAREADPQAERRVGRTLDTKVRRGSRLTFDLTMGDLEIDEPSQSVIWRGKPASVQFGVTVPADQEPQDLICKVTVSESSIPIGHLKFIFKVVAPGAAADTRPVLVGNLIRYRRAFISYARKDSAEVLKRVQMLNASKVNYFQDQLTLEPGDKWEKLIYQYIDQCDVFFLFWSTAARQSVWVEREITYARERQARNAEEAPEIVPIMIEGPPPPAPPESLSFLNFNDKFLYFIAAQPEGLQRK